MYGAETWTLTKVLESKIEAFEMWCFRRIGRISWRDKVSNDDVMSKLNTERQLLLEFKKNESASIYPYKAQKQHLDYSP